MDWSGLLVDYCDQLFWFHFDGTHSAQRIHWSASDAKLQHYYMNYTIGLSFSMIKQVEFSWFISVAKILTCIGIYTETYFK